MEKGKARLTIEIGGARPVVMEAKLDSDGWSAIYRMAKYWSQHDVGERDAGTRKLYGALERARAAMHKVWKAAEEAKEERKAKAPAAGRGQGPKDPGRSL